MDKVKIKKHAHLFRFDFSIVNKQHDLEGELISHSSDGDLVVVKIGQRLYMTMKKNVVGGEV